MGVERNIDITAAQRKIISDLLEAYIPDTKVWVYGSRVKWTAKPYSDLDMVAFSTKEQDMAVFELREAFEESDFPFRVDFFVWDEIPENFHENIKKEHVVFQESSEIKRVALSEFITLQMGFDPPANKRNKGNVPVVASTGLSGCHNEARVKGPGVVISHSGSIGGAQFIKEDFWPLNTTLWVKDFKGHPERFIYYLLN